MALVDEGQVDSSFSVGWGLQVHQLGGYWVRVSRLVLPDSHFVAQTKQMEICVI